MYVTYGSSHSNHFHPISANLYLPICSLAHSHSRTRLLFLSHSLSANSLTHWASHSLRKLSTMEVLVLLMMARENEREWVNDWIAQAKGQRNGQWHANEAPLNEDAQWHFMHTGMFDKATGCFGQFFFLSLLCMVVCSCISTHSVLNGNVFECVWMYSVFVFMGGNSCLFVYSTISFPSLLLPFLHSWYQCHALFFLFPRCYSLLSLPLLFWLVIVLDYRLNDIQKWYNE